MRIGYQVGRAIPSFDTRLGNVRNRRTTNTTFRVAPFWWVRRAKHTSASRACAFVRSGDFKRALAHAGVIDTVKGNEQDVPCLVRVNVLDALQSNGFDKAMA